jgi:hypothetical protein
MKLVFSAATLASLLIILSKPVGLNQQPLSSQTNSLFLVYLSGPQKYYGNYTQQQLQPNQCFGSKSLCWIMVQDTNGDGTISQNELNWFFMIYDSDADDNLDDEFEQYGILEKKWTS